MYSLNQTSPSNSISRHHFYLLQCFAVFLASHLLSHSCGMFAALYLSFSCQLRSTVMLVSLYLLSILVLCSLNISTSLLMFLHINYFNSFHNISVFDVLVGHYILNILFRNLLTNTFSVLSIFIIYYSMFFLCKLKLSS